MVGEDGVVTVTIPRADTIHLGGVVAKPETGPVAPTVAFEPLPVGQPVVVPDFAMIASEVQHVMRVMRGQGFVVNCLYNQETDESPQLFYSHQPRVSAGELRVAGINAIGAAASARSFRRCPAAPAPLGPSSA